MPVAAVVFDAYGTLFDVHSGVARCERFWPGRGQEISQLWRSKQLEYTWLRSLMGRYDDFAIVTGDALRHACATLGLDCTARQQTALLAEYRKLSAYADARPTLARLAGFRRAILSNGEPAMLKAAVEHAGLASSLEAVLSVDPLRIYKPHPSVYGLATRHFELPPEEIAFVTANVWDAAGAKSFGFRVFWIRRGNAPVEELPATPDRIIRHLAELPEVL